VTFARTTHLETIDGKEVDFYILQNPEKNEKPLIMRYSKLREMAWAKKFRNSWNFFPQDTIFKTSTSYRLQHLDNWIEDVKKKNAFFTTFTLQTIRDLTVNDVRGKYARDESLAELYKDFHDSKTEQKKSQLAFVGTTVEDIDGKDVDCYSLKDKNNNEVIMRYSKLRELARAKRFRKSWNFFPQDRMFDTSTSYRLKHLQIWVENMEKNALVSFNLETIINFTVNDLYGKYADDESNAKLVHKYIPSEQQPEQLLQLDQRAEDLPQVSVENVATISAESSEVQHPEESFSELVATESMQPPAENLNNNDNDNDEEDDSNNNTQQDLKKTEQERQKLQDEIYVQQLRQERSLEASKKRNPRTWNDPNTASFQLRSAHALKQNNNNNNKQLRVGV